MEKHVFWDTQPVVRSNNQSKIGVVNKKFTKKSNDKVTIIPKVTNWCYFDINIPKEFDEIHQFLLKNYKLDDDPFPLEFTKDILKWSLDLRIQDYGVKKLDSIKYWNLGIRSETGKLIGFITGVPTHYIIHGKSIDTLTINYLCVHRNLRSNGMAAMLIRELIRVIRETNPIFLTAPMFNADNLPFKSFCTTKFYYRYLNLPKLLDTGFAENEKNDLVFYNKHYSDFPCRKINIRQMQKTDLPQVFKIFKDNLKNYKVTIDFKTIGQFEDYFLRKPIYSYVIVDDNQNITDWVSFYYVPYKVKNKNQTLIPANILRIERTKTNLIDLMNNVFLIAKKIGFDFFNCQEMFNISDKIDDLKLCYGGVDIDYYTYNYDCGNVNPNEMGVIIP